MSIKISAVICTCNRAACLPQALESLTRQTLSPSEYEILVIDNCSTDETADVLRKFVSKAEGFKLKIAGTEEPGVSRARNLAVKLSEGEIIAFLDDDGLASPQWLSTLLETYASFPDAWAVGGRVLPLWEAERPDWLSDDLLHHLSLLDLGDKTRPLTRGEELIGVNCSFRRCVFTRLGLFRTDLGRFPGLLLGSEETEIQQRIREHGKPLYYSAQALVHHRVMPERLHTSYFIDLARGKGRTRARLMLTDPAKKNKIKWRLFRALLELLQSVSRPGDKRRRLYWRRKRAYWFSFLSEVLKTGTAGNHGRPAKTPENQSKG